MKSIDLYIHQPQDNWKGIFLLKFCHDGIKKHKKLRNKFSKAGEKLVC